MSERRRKIAIVGTVGLPARYGGFETLVENLAKYAEAHELNCDIEVYCSAQAYADQLKEYHKARLRYITLRANGIQSIIYDILSMVLARLRGADVILILGVSGAILLPLLRLTGGPRLIVNVDGLEWRREKWSRTTRWFLKWSERVAARFAHEVIGDNQAIIEHLHEAYAADAVLIPYGGDHAGRALEQGAGTKPVLIGDAEISEYAILLCRIEPENNIGTMLKAFRKDPPFTLVAVGNWEASEYGRDLRRQFSCCPGIIMLDPVFDPVRLHELRSNAKIYLHGHSAGGTNPALVEMMWLGRPVLAFDCNYNRNTTEGRAAYFTDEADLSKKLTTIDWTEFQANGMSMREIADRRYRWAMIGRSYFDLLCS